MPPIRSMLAVAALVLALVATGAFAELKEGRDYEVLAQAQPTEVVGKVEVLEFFWYGCPHCYALEPVLNKWLKVLPKDVAFLRIPADFGRWAQGARLFYALEAIGEEGRVRGELFDAIHLERLSYTKESDVSEWLVRKGVDKQKFTQAYASATVQSKVQRAKQLTLSYGVDGVPAVVVGGRYRASPLTVGGHEAMLATVDELIGKARAELAGQK